MDRAYAVLDVKAFDLERRTFSGIATTPTPDRTGDVVDPLGVAFRNPIPLLLHHDKTAPVGFVTFNPPTAEGITFDAIIPAVVDPGTVRDRVDEAWHSIKAGLLRGVSIGFRVMRDGAERLKGGAGFLLKRIEVCELSLVTIPSNVDATITTIKSIDLEQRAASRPNPSGVADIRVVRVDPAPVNKTTYAEQIKSFETTRKTKDDARVALMDTAAANGVTLDADQTKQYDDLTADIESIDRHLERLRALDASNAAAAKAVDTSVVVAKSAPVIQVKSQLPQGTAFVRAACAMLVCKGNHHEAAAYAERWKDSTPEVALYLKAAVAAGNATDAAWAGPLVNQNIANDFLELLRPATILGKIPGLRNVPFNTKIPSQTAGGTYGWVGEGKPKPVTKLAFSSDSLTIAKAAGIIVLTEELVRLSNPSAEALVRADMVAGIARFLDQQFIDPAVGAVAGVHPASITNGAPTSAATTNPLADVLTIINFFVTNNVPIEGLTIIMSQANALSLSFRTNLDGSPVFPGVGINGGNYRGVNFVTSQAANGWVIGVQPSYILYADDGGVTIDASREASLQMDSAPMDPADATTVYVSLWQNNLVGLRAERFVNWKRASAYAVTYLTAAAYPAPSDVAATGAGTGTTGTGTGGHSTGYSKSA